MSEPDRAEAKHYRENHVRRGAQPIAFHAEVERLQAEGRKGGVAAADAGHESQAPFRANQDAAFGSRVSREESDYETTAHVHKQRAERKSLAETPPDDAGKPLARHAPKSTAPRDEQVIEAIHHRSSSKTERARLAFPDDEKKRAKNWRLDGLAFRPSPGFVQSDCSRESIEELQSLSSLRTRHTNRLRRGTQGRDVHASR